MQIMRGIMKSVILCVFVVGVFGNPESTLKKWFPSLKKTITIEDVPYQISLRRWSNDTVICSGSLIANDTVLTAGQCVLDENDILFNDLVVVVGQTSLSEKNTGKIEVKRIILHSEFNNETLKNDIALLKLKNAVPDNLKNIKWVALTTTPLIEDSIAKASGWGLEGDKNATTLQVTNIIIGNECNIDIDDEQICGGSPWINANKAHSGGPVIYNGSLAGIISVATPPRNPQVFANVSAYTNWIAEASNLPEVYPYLVSLRYKDNDTHFCSGTLINGTDILTLAHCVENERGETVNASNIIVTASGENQSNQTLLLEINEIRIHPKYDGAKHNVAVIKLVEEIPANHTAVKWINLPIGKTDDDSICVTTGWKNSPSFYASTAKIDDYPRCGTDRVFCAETKHASEEASASDLGGPLICRYKLTGIFSSKYSSSLNIGHYINVSKYVPWILHGIDTTESDEDETSKGTKQISGMVVIAAFLYTVLNNF